MITNKRKRKRNYYFTILDSGTYLRYSEKPSLQWKLLLRENGDIIYSDAEVKKVFTASPLGVYKSAQNLKAFW